MYGKVFDSMFDGTLASRGPWQALVTFQQMIVLANPDGIVDMTAMAISRRTSIPLEIIELGIAELSKPDPESRTPDEDGRRIVLIDDHRSWGWQIVNHAKYQAMRNAAERREYLRVAQAERRERLRKEGVSTPVNNVNSVSAKVNMSTPTPTDSDADADINTVPSVLVGEADARKRKKAPQCPIEEILDAYHRALPALSEVIVVTDARKKHVVSRWREVCAQHEMDAAAALDWFAWYFKRVGESKFLMGGQSGRDGRVWKADFEWLMLPSSMAKVIEGRYHQ